MKSRFYPIFRLIFLLIAVVAPLTAMAQEAVGPVAVAVADTIPTISEQTDTVSPSRPGLVTRVLNYFRDTNKETPAKRFDFSFIGGPHYSSDAGFGIGLIAAGLYRADPTDTLMMPSSVSIFADATTNKYFNVGVEGYHLFARDRYRITYSGVFQSLATKFWGIGYDQEINDDNESRYDVLRMKVDARFLFHPARHLYMGPKFTFDYVHGRNFRKPWLWQGQGAISTTFGPGLSLWLDSRDNISNAYRGVYVALEQSFFPAFIGNKHAYSCTEFTVATYHQVWKGGVLAWRGHAFLGYGDMMWSQLSVLGDGHSMRGYYQGRYADKCSWDLCVELRQHLWRRNGAVVWVGAGEVFDKISRMRLNQILPNAGVGYRWEFKHRVNIRVDVGFGRNGAGFMFNINEAF